MSTTVERRVRTVRESLASTLGEAMAADESMVLLGETVRAGGAQGVARGLYERFGPSRVIETPVSENGIFGAALGLALSGFRPVVEIYSADFLLAVANEIVNDIAKWRIQHGQPGAQLPVLIRGCMGATAGLGPEHSQSMEPFFFHSPGLQICVPSTLENAPALLDAALESRQPTLFLEHRKVYELQGSGTPEPRPAAEPGTAEVVRVGTDLTMVAWGWMRTEAEAACATLAEHGVTVELVDPRWIRPFDYATVVNSVAKTGRLLVLEEAFITGGIGAEILARVTEAFPGRALVATRVAMPDVIHPYHAEMERQILPTAADAVHAALRLVRNQDES
ncbi:alpha-ketoacid dehydrogenase subunit beta [Nocardioides immobilis]|uniref:Alpha-ketoacid dehydrogenase subunit beta n=1 Tax=Nocardioides immobilis TaxID=2049295 RepID=A0A417XWT1_9ACTN|nr:transketolase C-terminal domain-containing protein [Nocardioides immobilis]RHW24949.1 alpha-ketoacid dehydrogenase subunit beta [Nocardioides immobilis]